MDVDELTRRRQAIIDRHGPWVAHNIELASGVYTIGPTAPIRVARRKRMLQIAADVAGRQVSELRVLDLASHEGQFAIEFARHGADVVAVEVRAAHVEKARLVRDWFGLENLELVNDDVRSVAADRYGSFDVVLCLGLLYHLDAEDGIALVRRLFQMCRHVAVVDTSVGRAGRTRHRANGIEYRGALYREHDEEASAEEREAVPGASIDNPLSFWFTRPSLFNLLADVGFSSVYQCLNPPAAVHQRDRLTLVAIKGTPVDTLASPNGAAGGRWPERAPRARQGQGWSRQLLLRYPRLEQRIRRAWRRLKGSPR